MASARASPPPAVCALDDQARFAVKANVGFCDFVIDAIGYYR